MNLAFTAPCLYPNELPIHYLLQSCKRQSIDLRPYGVGKQFGGWSDMIMHHGLPFIESLGEKGFTHVCYVDGIDSLFLADTAEILRKYEMLGKPAMLLSADSDLFPNVNGQAFNGPPPWRYLNGGGFLAEISYLLILMQALYERHKSDGNYQGWFVRSWPLSGASLDHHCVIFQPMDGNAALEIAKHPVRGNRLFNAVTYTYPCVLHFRGGYVDPEIGRDDRMRPWIEKLYGGESC